MFVVGIDECMAREMEVQLWALIFLFFAKIVLTNRYMHFGF
ncbi:unnamed protein product [Brassica oleracea var. botrytis]|uniref:(rape) hypothetical protein n=1 Tax=Brassica napus TaxID=3708 RepID=A0A816JYQ0_BRANA|nr:unnamed protein product [Brassica napus]